MRWDLKICANKKCGEVIGCFPKKKCRFCGWVQFHLLQLEANFIDGNDNPYYEKSAHCGVVENYKGSNHLFIRVPLGKGNNCDANGGYIHIIDIPQEHIKIFKK